MNAVHEANRYLVYHKQAHAQNNKVSKRAKQSQREWLSE